MQSPIENPESQTPRKRSPQNAISARIHEAFYAFNLFSQSSDMPEPARSLSLYGKTALSMAFQRIRVLEEELEGTRDSAALAEELKALADAGDTPAEFVARLKRLWDNGWDITGEFSRIFKRPAD